MRMKRKKRTKPGSSFLRALGRFVIGLLILGAPVVPECAGKDRKSNAPSYAVVAGTVFRDNGFSLPGAEVEIGFSGSPDPARKFKKMKQMSDRRGEFAFRVPSGAAEYKVSVRAAGYQGDEKQVSVGGDERVDVFFRLQPASK